jgi:hypothetical protein
MSFIVTEADLKGLAVQQLRAKRAESINDPEACGLRLEHYPHIQISIRFIDSALAGAVPRSLERPRPCLRDTWPVCKSIKCMYLWIFSGWLIFR